MNNPFSFEKGMEVLEQGGNTAKQQLNSTKQAITGQVTGQQPTPQQQNGQPQVLDSFKEQLLGKPQQPKPALTSVHDQILGEAKPAAPTESLQQQIMGGVDTPKTDSSSTETQLAQQKSEKDFINDLYGPSNPEQPTAVDQQAMEAKAQADQKKQQDTRALLQNYFQPEIEQKMAQLRQQRTQKQEEEEKQEEQQKMQELQVEEKKKDEDIVLRRVQNKAETKAAGAG